MVLKYFHGMHAFELISRGTDLLHLSARLVGPFEMSEAGPTFRDAVYRSPTLHDAAVGWDGP